MLITPFVRDDSFDPDLMDTMSSAFSQACSALGLFPKPDPFTELVAHHIIKGARSGLRTQTALCVSAILEFRSHPH